MMTSVTEPRTPDPPEPQLVTFARHVDWCVTVYVWLVVVARL
jgi:hypothetical protein